MNLVHIDRFDTKDKIIEELKNKNLFEMENGYVKGEHTICEGWHIQEFSGYYVKDDNSYSPATFLIEPIKININQKKIEIDFNKLNLISEEDKENYLFFKGLDDQGRQTFGSDGGYISLYIFNINNQIIEIFSERFSLDIKEICTQLNYYILKNTIQTNNINKIKHKL